MCLKAKVAIGLGILFILTLSKVPARAQGVTAALSGTVTDSSGKTVPNAKVTAMNAGTGKSTDTQTDASGNYSLPNLTLGLYEVSVSAEGIGSGSAEVALSPPISQQLDISVASPPAPPERIRLRVPTRHSRPRHPRIFPTLHRAARALHRLATWDSLRRRHKPTRASKPCSISDPTC